MKNLSFLLATILIAFASIASAQQWQTISSGTSEGLNKIAFFSSTSGFVVGNDGTLLRTNDGGATWQQMQNTADSQNIDFYDVISPASGVIIASGEVHWNQPGIAISRDGGETWQTPQMPANVRSGISSVTFITPSVGFATAGSYVLNTIDGGLTWSATEIAKPYFLNHIAFTDAQHGIVCGGMHDMTGFTMHTNDGGATWTNDNDNYIEPVFTAQSTDATHTWRVGGDPEFGGYISHTNDGGVSWSHLVLPDAAPGVTDVFFSDSLHGVAVSGIHVLATNDAGETWSQTQLTQSGNPLYSMTVDQSGAFWVVGWNGAILKTSSNPSAVASPSATLSSFALQQNFPNPVSQATQISFTTPSQSNVSLNIYSVDGKEVKTLIESATMDAGTHSIGWDATGNDGARLTNGTYLYKLTAGELTMMKRLTIVK